MRGEVMKEELIAELQHDSGSLRIYQAAHNRNFQYWAVSNGLLSDLTGETSTVTRKVDRFPDLIKLSKMHFKQWNELTLVRCTKFERDIRKSMLGERTHYNSQLRILDLFYRLLKEKVIHVQQATIDYGVHKETIKTDIYQMREVLENDFVDIVATTKQESYEISASNQFTVGDAFALLLMIYHNKSLSIEEIKVIQTKIIGQFSITKQKEIRTFFQSYEYFYRGFHSRDLLGDVEVIFEAIQQHKLVTFTYQKYDGTSKVRIVQPLTIILHDKAFYLVGNEIGSKKEGTSNFGLDRVFDLQTKQEVLIPNKGEDRFQPGKYANQSFNMYTDKLETVQLKIKAGIKPYFFRKFPDGQMIEEDKESFIAEVEVGGTEGILFWILSQKADVEVIRPDSLRKQMKNLLTEMLQLYSD